MHRSWRTVVRPVLDAVDPSVIALGGAPGPRLLDKVARYCEEQDVVAHVAHVAGSEALGAFPRERFVFHDRGTPMADVSRPMPDVFVVDGVNGDRRVTDELLELGRRSAGDQRAAPVVLLGLAGAHAPAEGSEPLSETWSEIELPGSPRMTILVSEAAVRARPALGQVLERFGSAEFLHRRLVIAERARAESDLLVVRTSERGGELARKLAEAEKTTGALRAELSRREHELQVLATERDVLTTENTRVAQALVSARSELLSAAGASETSARAAGQAQTRAQSLAAALEVATAHEAQLKGELADAREAARQAAEQAERLRDQVERSELQVMSITTARDQSEERLREQARALLEERDQTLETVRDIGASRSWRWGAKTFRAMRTLTFRPPKRADAMTLLVERLEDGTGLEPGARGTNSD